MNAPDNLPPSPPEDNVARLRVPPHSLESEQALLGGLLLEPDAFGRISDALGAPDFYRHEHRLIFQAIEALISDARGVDVLTVNERLQTMERGPEAGGLPYLNALAQAVPSAANIRRYAEIIAERATLRALVAVSDEIATAAFNPQGRPVVDILDDAKVAVGRIAEGRKLGSRRVPLLSLGELREQSNTVSWLVKHVVPAESIGMLYGGSGTFKSFIAIDAALHIAHGLPWMGRRTKQGTVLYIAAEGGSGLWPRIVAWHRARRLQWKDVPFHVVPAALDLTADSWRVVEAAQGKGINPVLVVVDTLSQTYAGEENSANEMAAYFRELGTRFRQLWKCAVLLIHHTGHQATERPRGSSAIRANLDFMLGVFRDEKEMLATLTCAKQKDGEAFEDATFRVTVHDLKDDEDGDKVTSLVARHLTSAEDVQEALESESKAGRGGKNLLFLKLAQNGCKEADLRQTFYAECGAENQEARRQAYTRARTWAIRQGFVDIAEGYVITLKPQQGSPPAA